MQPFDRRGRLRRRARRSVHRCRWSSSASPSLREATAERGAGRVGARRSRARCPRADPAPGPLPATTRRPPHTTAPAARTSHAASRAARAARRSHTPAGSASAVAQASEGSVATAPPSATRSQSFGCNAQRVSRADCGSCSTIQRSNGPAMPGATGFGCGSGHSSSRSSARVSGHSIAGRTASPLASIRHDAVHLPGEADCLHARGANRRADATPLRRARATTFRPKFRPNRMRRFERIRDARRRLLAAAFVDDCDFEGAGAEIDAEKTHGIERQCELGISTRMVPGTCIFRHRNAASETRRKQAESPDRGLTPPRREPHAKQALCAGEIHPIDSHTYPLHAGHARRVSAASPLQRARRRFARARTFRFAFKGAHAYRHRECRNRPQWSCCAFSSPIPWSHPKTRWWRQTICNRTRFTRATSDCPRASCSRSAFSTFW